MAESLSSLIFAASKLSVEQQLELNKALCQLIRQKRKIEQAVAGAQFVPGQLVRFDAKTRGIKIIKIMKFNRAGTAVVGYEHNAKGEQTSTMKWTVSTTICTLVQKA